MHLCLLLGYQLVPSILDCFADLMASSYMISWDFIVVSKQLCFKVLNSKKSASGTSRNSIEAGPITFHLSLFFCENSKLACSQSIPCVLKVIT